MTDTEDISWKNMCFRQTHLFYKRHEAFFRDNVLKPEVHIDECIKEFLYPFVDKLL